MRALFLLRGAPGAGKSTWIRENNLAQYTISPDELRVLFQTPELDVDGDLGISQKNDNFVWGTVYKLLERRMRRGELCIVDATHYKRELFTKYKDMAARWRYRVYIVDFTDTPLETLKARNRSRSAYKVVPDSVIEKMYEVFKAEELMKQVSNRFKVISRSEALEILNDKNLMVDWSDKSRIVVFGDIHGCMEPVEKYFAEHPFDPDTQYVFVGDYLDRGIQNDKVVDFLLYLKKKPNVLLLTGNHERWLAQYANNEEFFNPSGDEKATLKKYMSKAEYTYLKLEHPHSPVFDTETVPQLAGFKKSVLRDLTNKFAQLAYFKYGDRVYTITHGGIPCKPSVKLASEEYTKGVGDYGQIEAVYESWIRNTPENYIQLNGHRNINRLPANYKDRCYNLCTAVERGASLRVATITPEGVSVEEFANTVFRVVEPVVQTTPPTEAHTVPELVAALNASEDIRKAPQPNGIVSYNYGNKIFYTGNWNSFSVKARGLFLRGEEVVARGYAKFFNLGEVPQTQWKSLEKNLQFPVTAYRKENGFLGLMSWDRQQRELIIASKGSMTGDFAGYFRAIWDTVSQNTREQIIAYLQEHNVTLVYEVIDPTNDPHIIEYDKAHLVLLEAVENTIEEFRPLEYSELARLAAQWGIQVKAKVAEFTSAAELGEFIHEQDTETNRIEGFVFRDSANFQFKLKTKFYRKWKYIRALKDTLARGGILKQNFQDATEVQIMAFLHKFTPEQLNKMSVIQIRKLWEGISATRV